MMTVHDGSDKKIFLALDIDIHSWSQYDKWQEPIGNLKIRDRSRGVDQGGSLEAEDRPAELGDLDGIVQTNTLVPVAGRWGGLGEDKLNCFVAGASPLTKQCLEKKVGLYQSSQKDRASHNTGLGSRRGSTGAGSSYIIEFHEFWPHRSAEDNSMSYFYILSQAKPLITTDGWYIPLMLRYKSVSEFVNIKYNN